MALVYNLRLLFVFLLALALAYSFLQRTRIVFETALRAAKTAFERRTSFLIVDVVGLVNVSATLTRRIGRSRALLIASVLLI
jgi:hypothetical protein